MFCLNQTSKYFTFFWIDVVVNCCRICDYHWYACRSFVVIFQFAWAPAEDFPKAEAKLILSLPAFRQLFLLFPPLPSIGFLFLYQWIPWSPVQLSEGSQWENYGPFLDSHDHLWYEIIPRNQWQRSITQKQNIDSNKRNTSPIFRAMLRRAR